MCLLVVPFLLTLIIAYHAAVSSNISCKTYKYCRFVNSDKTPSSSFVIRFLRRLLKRKKDKSYFSYFRFS